MSKTEFNYYLVKAITRFKAIFRQKDWSYCKKTWRECKINFK